MHEPSKLLARHASMCSRHTCIDPASPLAATPLRLPLSMERNGSYRFHSGCLPTTAFTRCSANTNCAQAGCFGHSVPSLSNTAIRSARGMKFLDSGVVISVTKSLIDHCAGVSFQDASAAAVDAPLFHAPLFSAAKPEQAETRTTAKAMPYRRSVRIRKASSKSVGRTSKKRRSNWADWLLHPAKISSTR
ncbi:hypothetical protein QFZ91_003090 [Paraburkholderia sp. JPY419]